MLAFAPCVRSSPSSRQAFVAAGLVIFIASAKMAIDPNVVRAKLSGEQLVNMQDMIKHQIRRSMKATVKMQKKMQKKDVKSRDSDTQEVKTLEGKVAGLESIVSKLVKSEKVLVKTDVKAARRQPAIIIARNHGDGGGSAEGAPREDMPAEERREVQMNRADWRQSERCLSLSQPDRMPTGACFSCFLQGKPLVECGLPPRRSAVALPR
ncbi:MAG: hypothetical protein ACPIOQ_07985 [Promethearchaeia archaeon]